jgi:hypothetical protein
MTQGGNEVKEREVKGREERDGKGRGRGNIEVVEWTG